MSLGGRGVKSLSVLAVGRVGLAQEKSQNQAFL